MYFNIDFMKMAISEAENSLKNNDYPVGAVLVIDDNLIGVSNNSLTTNDDYISHAELKLLSLFSKEIKRAHKLNKNIDIYTTLEPCLMCYGAMLLHRVNNLFISCPDPHGGFSLNDINLNGWYLKNKLSVKNNILIEQSLPLMLKFFESKKDSNWLKTMELFKKIDPNQCTS